MRVFIVSVPSIGHVRSMAPVARCLVSRGHEVHWAANGTVSYVQATGVTLHSVLPDDLSEEGQRFSGGRAHEIDNWFLQKWFVPIAEQALRPTLKLAEIVEPDLVVTDATALWGGIVAESIGRPWASYCPGLFMSSHARQLAISELQRPQEPMNWAGRRAVGSSFWALERRLNALRHEVGLPSEPSLNRVSEALILCFTTRAVEFDGAGLPSQARCVGPVFNSTLDVDPFPAEDPDIPQGDEPLVYVSLGRVYGGMQGREDDIVDALAHLDVRAVVAGGTNGRPYASNRRIRYATRPISQSAVLRHAAAVVSGGFNTVHEALSHGLPVVAVPLAGDEPALAGRIDELGLGVAVARSRSSPSAIAAAVRRVLDEGSFRHRAGEFAREARFVNGVRPSVRLLEGLGGGAIGRAEEDMLFEHLPRRPVVASRFSLSTRGDGVAVASYVEELEVHDRASAEAVRWLWTAADGATPIEELLERWDGKANLPWVIAGLTQRGILLENDGRSSLDDDTRRRYREQIMLFSHASTSSESHAALQGNEFQERLRAARVALVGAGVLGSNVFRGLCLAGIGKILVLGSGEVDGALIDAGGWFASSRSGETCTAALAAQARELRPDLVVEVSTLPDLDESSGRDRDGMLAEQHVLIVALDRFDAAIYRWVDESAQLHALQWTSIRRSRMGTDLGPTVIPGQTACFRCYELRRAGNVAGDAGIGRSEAGFFQFAVGPEWVVLEVVKLLTGFGEAVTVGKVVSFDPLALKLTAHRVLRLPNCSRCRVDPDLPPEIPWRPIPAL